MKGNRLHLAAMPFQDAELPPLDRIPNADGFIVAAGSQKPTVG